MPAYGMKRSKGGGGGSRIGSANVDPRQVARDGDTIEDIEKRLAAEYVKRGGKGKGEGDAGTESAPILVNFNKEAKNASILGSFGNAARVLSSYSRTGSWGIIGAGLGVFSRAGGAFPRGAGTAAASGGHSTGTGSGRTSGGTSSGGGPAGGSVIARATSFLSGGRGM